MGNDMKRLGILIVTILLLMCGCGKDDVNIPKIDEYEWLMSSIQCNETDGQAIAYGERGSSTLDTAMKLEMTCAANSGKLIITDKTNNKSYTGTYEFEDTSTQSAIYKVVIDGKEGMAVVSITTYQDGSDEPTFIISLEGYAINFYKK